MKNLLLCVVAIAWSLAAHAQVAKPLLGIMPVFDASGHATGEIISQNLTFMIYQELRSSAVEPVLLNPGALYNPIYTESIAEFSDLAHVPSVLITTLQPFDKPKSGPWTVKVEAVLMNVATGKSSPVGTHSFSIDRREVGIEYSHYGRFFETGASRPFAKQPLGKGALSIARDIRAQVSSASEYLSATPPPPAPIPAGSCDISFKVVYTSAKAYSKSYGVSINGKEESLGMKEGVIPQIHVTNGPLVVHVTVNDAPYKLPVQRLYQANDVVNCGNDSRALALEIGPAGEGLLRWR
ncbi:MAG: hypothetical protein ACR2IF_04315 [Terriglobales bacterium]